MSRLLRSRGNRQSSVTRCKKWGVACVVLLLATSALQGQEVPDLEKQLDSDDPAKVAAAIRELGELGVKAESAVPSLIRLFADDRNGSSGMVWGPTETLSGLAASAVVHVGKSSVPYLVKSLENEDSKIRIVTAKTLGRMGREAADAVPTLVRGCDDPDREVRRYAVIALGLIQSRLEIAVPRLRELATEDSDEWVRHDVAETLAALDNPGCEVVETLCLMLKDPSPEVRGAAARAIGEVAPRAVTAIPHMIEALADEEYCWHAYSSDVAGQEPVYDDVVKSLVLLGKAVPKQLPLIVEAMNTHPNGQVRAGAALVLIRLSAQKDQALKALQRELEGRQDGVGRALEALFELGEDGRDAESRVLSFLDHDDKHIRLEAVSTLGAVAGPPGIAALIDAMNDKDVAIRTTAAGALGDLGPPAADAIPALVEALDHPDLWLHENAAEALGKIGPAAAAATPALINVLADHEQDGDFRAIAATALGEIAPRDSGVLSCLLEALDDKPKSYSYDFQDAVIAALGKAGPAAKQAASKLHAILNSENEWDDVRASSLRSLIQMGEASEETIALCMQTLESERSFVLDERLRLESARTLGLLRVTSALPVLKKAAADDNEYESVRAAAAESVRQIPAKD